MFLVAHIYSVCTHLLDALSYYLLLHEVQYPLQIAHEEEWYDDDHEGKCNDPEAVPWYKTKVPIEEMTETTYRTSECLFTDHMLSKFIPWKRSDQTAGTIVVGDVRSNQ